MSTTTTTPRHFQPSEIGDATRRFYDEEGYLIVDNAFSADEVDELVAEAAAICRGQRGEVPLGQFHGDLNEDDIRAGDAFAGLSDDEVMAQFLCLHFPHKLSSLIRRQLAHPVVRDTLVNVIGPNVKCMQSMLFVKAAGKPGQAWHQDEDFIPTRDRSLCGAWIALDDAHVDNGCLWIIPSSHEHWTLWPQFPQDDDRFDCAEESYDFPYTDDESVPVEVKRGSVVFFNGYTLHRSLPNVTQAGFRRSLVNHYMSAESFLPWQRRPGDEKTPVAKLDNRDIVMIAGKDPYAWKGTTDMFHTHVRPAGEGGCGDGRMNLKTFKETQPLEVRSRK